MKKKVKPENKETFSVDKYFCPVCGSTKIERAKNAFICTNCKSLFSKQARTNVELRKKPRYIG